MSTNPYETPETEGYVPPRKWKWPSLAIQVLVAVLAVVGLLVASLLPAVRMSGEAARRMQCGNNLKQIALALKSYEDAYGYLPPAYTVDAAGKPLHSWRTLILPYMEHKGLYEKIDLSKPWDDPANQALAKDGPAAYRCPSGDASRTETNYLAIVAPGGCFKLAEPRKRDEITDGPDQTLMVIDVASEQAVPWMSPSDATEAVIANLWGGKRTHPNGTNAVFVDGHVHFLRRDTDPQVLQALISIAGNDGDITEDGY